MNTNIESHLTENRKFKPRKSFSKHAHISSFERYEKLYRKSIKDPKRFWAKQASELLVWHKKLRNELRQHVGTVIGAIAKPDDIRFADALPKTRSGKIMRRLLKELASSGQVTGDTTTLEDLSVLAKLTESEE
jgi:acyl-CoA synthetase (AMP-forming)/AMP-acid ligase II